MTTNNGIQFEIVTKEDINNDTDWTQYDKTVAQTHADNYELIYIDSFGFPIDSENDLQEIEEYMNR